MIFESVQFSKNQVSRLITLFLDARLRLMSYLNIFFTAFLRCRRQRWYFTSAWDKRLFCFYLTHFCLQEFLSHRGTIHFALQNYTKKM